jgi:hypothetical protein
MRSLKYLNAILTLIAVVLTLHLWAMWVGGSGAGALVMTSEAQAAGRPVGIPNAAAQRKEMVDLLKSQNVKIDQLVKLFKTGKARVKIDRSQAK